MPEDATTSAQRTEPKGTFDVVVIGSGFGGSVMAYRLASAGYSVCVLERGRSYPPGTFPRTPKQMGKNFWEPHENLFGLFDIWSFRHAEAIVASGLGGGSLIYANVLLRKDENWFVQEPSEDQANESWPVTRAQLDPHYDRVEAVLKPTPYPFADQTPKTKAFMLAGKALSHPAAPAPLAITFDGDGSGPALGERIRETPNYHGKRGTRYTCRLTGECDLGCNWGSKNTLDFNYLTMAHKAGAEIRTRCEVKRFEPKGGRGEKGWIVTYVDLAGEDGDPSAAGHWRRHTEGRERRVEVESRAVVLAAGCFGSTYLMQKMQDRRALQDLSPMVGKRFSGNGDFLSFAARCRDWKGDELVPHTIDASYGPVITSYLRYPDRLDDPDNAQVKSRGFYLEDGGFPNIAAWGIEIANTPGVARRAAAVAWQSLMHRVGKQRSTIGAEAARFIGDAEYSGGTLPILGMGRDYPDGELTLSKKGYLELNWRRKRSNAYFGKVREASSYVATALAARDFKISLSWYLRRLLTVHPLGGLPMGNAPENGAVDAWGRVFGYENLYVADGSVMPGPVGPNPSLTIAALADRFADRAIENLGSAAVLPPIEIEDTPAKRRIRGRVLPAGASAPAGAEHLDVDAPPVQVSFTEEMDGFVTFGDGDDFEEGFQRGRRDGNAIGFNITIDIEDVATFIRDPAHEARVEGYVESRDFGRAQPVATGVFNLFTLIGDPPEKQMLYELPFQDGNGNPFILRGHKVVKDDFGLDLWPDLTTLFTHIIDGRPPPGQEGRTIAYGILHINARAFIEQLKTFSSTDGMPGLVRFGRFFFGNLAETYGPHLFERGGDA
jgi:cholesterol oxidase